MTPEPMTTDEQAAAEAYRQSLVDLARKAEAVFDIELFATLPTDRMEALPVEGCRMIVHRFTAGNRSGVPDTVTLEVTRASTARRSYREHRRIANPHGARLMTIGLWCYPGGAA